MANSEFFDSVLQPLVELAFTRTDFKCDFELLALCSCEVPDLIGL